MKIAFRLSNMGFGGAERVFLSVADYLVGAYHVQVEFVVDSIGKGETEHLIQEKGFNLVGLDSNSTLHSILPLKRYLDLSQPDLMISAYTDTNVGAVISSKLSAHECKVVVSEHASLNEHWQYATLKRRLLLNAYVKFGYKLANHVLAVSNGIEQQLIDKGLTTTAVSSIYNPVRFNSKAVQQSKLKSKCTKPIILAVGRITKQKDYLTLLKAFCLLLNTMDAQLVIVGGVHESEEKAKLDDFIRMHTLSDRVELVGFTDNVEGYYASADIFVLSSAWEGFGNVIVEALAFGLPVVSTDCNHGPAEILESGQYGRLVPVGDSVAMANALKQVLIENPFDYSRQVARASDFTEEKVGEAYYQLFQKVMRGL